MQVMRNKGGVLVRAVRAISIFCAIHLRDTSLPTLFNQPFSCDHETFSRVSKQTNTCHPSSLNNHFRGENICERSLPTRRLTAWPKLAI